MKKTVLAVSAMLLSGCVTLGPDYAAPTLEVPTKFVGGASDGLRDAATMAWWRTLDDPVLNEFVAVGLGQNLDVQTALERLVTAEANARRFGVIGQQLGGNASYDARRRSTEGVIDGNATLNGDAVFSLDLFGEFRRAREQSLAELDAAQFDVGTVKLAYLSDIVTTYILIQYFRQAAQITRDTIATRRETLNVVRERFEVQEGTQLDVAQARSLLANAEATLPILAAQAQVNTFRMATLLNMPTGVVAASLTARGVCLARPESLRLVPADLLRNRPDIRSAERNLAAATAGVGVSEAQLYPSLRLAGGVSVGEIDTWAFGPSLILPVFDQTNRRVNRDIALSGARQAELAYRQTYIAAIEEVQTALTLTRARQDQVTAYVQATTSSEQVLNLARRSYEAGVVAIDEVLDADRTRLSNRLNLAQAQSDLAQAWVRQQVAVGKGWATAVPGSDS